MRSLLIALVYTLAIASPSFSKPTYIEGLELVEITQEINKYSEKVDFVGKAIYNGDKPIKDPSIVIIPTKNGKMMGKYGGSIRGRSYRPPSYSMLAGEVGTFTVQTDLSPDDFDDIVVNFRGNSIVKGKVEVVEGSVNIKIVDGNRNCPL